MCEIEKRGHFGEIFWLRPECLILDPGMSGHARVISALQDMDVTGSVVVNVRLFNNGGARVELHCPTIPLVEAMVARLGLGTASVRGWMERLLGASTDEFRVQIWNDGAKVYGGVELMWVASIS